jgi:hypothetical protein
MIFSQGNTHQLGHDERIAHEDVQPGAQYCPRIFSRRRPVGDFGRVREGRSRGVVVEVGGFDRPAMLDGRRWQVDEGEKVSDLVVGRVLCAASSKRQA